MAHVRDRPPLRESVEITTPRGNRYRWSDDEDSAANVPSGERFTDTMPGGFAEHDAVLPRKANIDYADLERLSTITRYDAAGGIIWQGRLERAPKVSGDQMAISPSAVGWQAHLEDDKSASMVYIDRDLGRWGGASSARILSLIGSFSFMSAEPPVVQSDATSGLPQLDTGWDENGGWATTSTPISEGIYDAGPGNLIGRIRASWTKGIHVNAADVNFSWSAFLAADDAITSSAGTGNLRATGPGTIDYVALAEWRYAGLQNSYGTSGGTTGQRRFAIYWTNVRIFGDHGLTIRGDTAAEEGLYASDIVTHAVGRWAPLLTITTESVAQSAFVVPQLVFYDSTNAGEIIRQATRFGLQDWAVWEDLTFWWHDRGARGNQWRARVGPSQLEETGPQVERIWESVIVQYQDVDGSTRTAGPVDSGADTETDDLKDDDPDNPANKLGITRRVLLVMGIGTAASATEVGRRFLEESRVLDSSGRARLVGHVQDSHGVWHPYSHVRAGDTISFVDSSDTSYRRIVRTDKNRDDRSCSVDLDAPPEGLQALLERLGVVLVPLGV